MNQHQHVMANVNCLYLFHDLAGSITKRLQQAIASTHAFLLTINAEQDRQWKYLLATSMVMTSQIVKVGNLLDKACDGASDKLRTAVKAIPLLQSIYDWLNSVVERLVQSENESLPPSLSTELHSSLRALHELLALVA